LFIGEYHLDHAFRPDLWLDWGLVQYQPDGTGVVTDALCLEEFTSVLEPHKYASTMLPLSPSIEYGSKERQT